MVTALIFCFCKWLKSELELQGIASFIVDRAKYLDSQSHEIADMIVWDLETQQIQWRQGLGLKYNRWSDSTIEIITINKKNDKQLIVERF